MAGEYRLDGHILALCLLLKGKLDNVSMSPAPVFGFLIPDVCPGVPKDILKPQNTWNDGSAYKFSTVCGCR
ncbi:MAG: hypothetical protein N3E45_11935 [Oscillatoriaceae bacterium SKW80]|nr:hypothetical protein [Oscillatoriaceae bacterium SKYG93]MCX8121513.1 hypothetical protein [Oscillatoriaceae bacterium SKW80]MDW8452901.1 hypothetical protein [Oscillatoriaceae cyanobacterium SKYGB_i_bin93]HIK27858.1 hypothetical protein [Oscillatoriaceae cyanobacterium M7585_C2015_266]